jgi:hypothetical protein
VYLVSDDEEESQHEIGIGKIFGASDFKQSIEELRI